MAKFNKNQTGAVLNKESAPAFRLSPELELFTRAATAMIGEPKFYDADARESDTNIIDLAQRVAQNRPDFVLKLASYVRNELNLRSVPVVLLVETARVDKGSGLVRAMAPSIIRRPDELTEAIAYWQARYGDIGDKGLGQPFPNSLKRGLADAAARFDEWQIARYRAQNAPVKMRDVIRIVSRRRDYPFSAALRAFLVDGTVDREALPVIAALKDLGKKEALDADALALISQGRATWEQAVMQFGNRRDVWDAVLPYMGYMAVLRNLRNLIQAGVEMAPVLERLTDPEQVRKSKQLPFRFFSAYRELQKARTGENRAVIDAALVAVSQAVESSVANVPRLIGGTVVAVDLSGSMHARIAKMSTVSLREIASLMGALTSKICEASLVIAFASDVAAYRTDPERPLLKTAAEIASINVGGSTLAYKAPALMLQEKIEADRLVVLSDMQCYAARGGLAGDVALSEKVKEYREKVNPNLKVYSVDLAGYGSSQFPEGDLNTALLAGWSERIIELIGTLERGEDVLKEIEGRAALPAPVTA